MGNVNPAYHDRVRYTLQYKPYGSQVIQDPEGWNEDEKEISRNEDYHGIFAKFSNSLKFVGTGADFILSVDEIFGVNAKIRLIKDERNDQTDLWETSYYGYLDLTTLEVENGEVSIKFSSGGLEQLLKARQGESVEIERTTTMDGKPMAPVRIDKVQLDGRRILLTSLFNTKESDNTATIYQQAPASNGGLDRAKSVGVPLNLYSESHEEAQSVTPETYGGENSGTTGIMFFANSEAPTRTFNIKLDITFTSNCYQNDDVNHAFWGLFLSKYSNGEDYSDPERLELWNSDDHGGVYGLGGDWWLNPFSGQNSNPKKTWTVSYQGAVTLLLGQSLDLEFYSKCNLSSTLHDGHFAVRAEGIVATLSIVEDSYREATQSKFILAHELAGRLVEIMTNDKTAFRSNFFGRVDIGYPENGKGALNGYTHGFWVRGFDANPPSTEDVINSFKPLTTSFQEFTASNQAVWNVGLGIENFGYKERIVIEDLKWFYQNQVTVRLPNRIQKEKYSVATKYLYSGLEIGYAKGGDYEEAMGLDEYNAKSTFTTVITAAENKFSQVSPYRADSYGKEFARRKPLESFPTEDSSYDNDIFIMDLKRNPSDPGTPYSGPYVFLERKWQDDFAQAPTGTYSPETATNLRLSPINMLLRHAWYFGAGFTKYISDYVRYGSSTANSSLKTKPIGGIEHAENGNIINSELERARFVPRYIEFEHDVTGDIMRQIEGTTVINGVSIPNMYGLIEFEDENGNLKRGFFINLQPNQGKFKLLIANR